MLKKYTLKNGVDTILLDITEYYVHALENLEGWSVMPSLDTFNSQHEKTVNQLLERANITYGKFIVIQWRLGRKGIDYMKCAQLIVGSYETIKDGNTPFMLMASLNLE